MSALPNMHIHSSHPLLNPPFDCGLGSPYAPSIHKQPPLPPLPDPTPQRVYSQLGLPLNVLSGRDVHVHFPAGAVSKDGPSAGVAIISALYSVFTGNPVPATAAMTGEITLAGNVCPVGGTCTYLLL